MGISPGYFQIHKPNRTLTYRSVTALNYWPPAVFLFVSFLFLSLSSFLSFSASRIKKKRNDWGNNPFPFGERGGALIEGHSNTSTCAVEIRRLGINRLHFKSFEVISGMSQRPSPSRPVCCPQPSLFTVRLNCSHSFNKARTERKNNSSVIMCRGNWLGLSSAPGARTGN